MSAPRALRVVGGAIVLAFLATAFTPFANALHRVVVSPPPPPEPAQAIVVLGAGKTGHELSDASLRRTLHGIELFRQGLAPVLVMLGGPGEGPEAEANARLSLARDMGVPAEALASDTRGKTTREEASVSRQVLSPRGAKKILLVTGREHMLRAAALFRRAGFEVVEAPVDELHSAAARPQDRLNLARGILRELIARVYNRAAGYM